jgi:hypothetical protein
MSKEKLYGLRDQLSKFLYDPTPEQAAWRKKMWDEGRFDESMDITKRVETQLEGVEKQIEAVEAAEPELGEKMVTNFLLNLPLGKQLKGTGLGSLLGLAEEEMGAAEAQRLDDIKKEINQLNAIRQRDLEGGRVSSGTIRKIDADIRALENEGENILQILRTDEYEALSDDLHDEVYGPEEIEKGKGAKAAGQMLNDPRFADNREEYIKTNIELLQKNLTGEGRKAFSTSQIKELEEQLAALQQGEKEGLMSLLGDTPTTEDKEVKKINMDPESISNITDWVESNQESWKKNNLLTAVDKYGLKNISKAHLQKNKLVDKDGNITFYRYLNIAEGKPLQVEEGVKSLTTDLEHATKMAKKQSVLQKQRLKKGVTLTKEEEKRLTTPFDLALSGKLESYTLTRPATILAYKVPLEKVEGYLPAIWKNLGGDALDGYKRFVAEDRYANQIDDLIEEGFDYEDALDEVANSFVVTDDIDSFAETIFDESEALVDLTGIKPTKVITPEANIKGYQGGGLIMNYGDYGRGYV